MSLPQNMILIYKFLGRMVHFFTARFACMRIHFQSNFIRAFINGQRKMEAVLQKSGGKAKKLFAIIGQ